MHEWIVLLDNELQDIEPGREECTELAAKEEAVLAERKPVCF